MKAGYTNGFAICHAEFTKKVNFRKDLIQTRGNLRYLQRRVMCGWALYPAGHNFLCKNSDIDKFPRV